MNELRTFSKNEIIFKEGVYERCMYDIHSGSVDIYVNYGTKEEQLLTTLDAGHFFGEIGIAEVMPRTATAVAAADNTTLYEITTDNFSAYFRNDPMKVLTIMKHMSERLRTLTKEYMDARETISEAISTSKSGKKHSEGLMTKLSKLVPGSLLPSFLSPKAFEEAEYLKKQTEQESIYKIFRKNEIIFREGDQANCLYDIHWGGVGIYANYGTSEQTLLAELKPDEFFGEMGILDHMPRSATAVALEPNTKVRMITEESFSEYLVERPAKVMMILMHLSSRIRGLTNDYMEICRLAETAAQSYENDRLWTDYLSESAIEAYSTPLDPWEFNWK